jgi:signal transduction histidine kinase
MRTRLILLIMWLMGIVLLAMGIPLASTISNSYTREVFLNRLNDTARFAAIVQQADAANQLDNVLPELRRYESVYGIQCAVLASDRSVRLASSGAALPTDATAAQRISNAIGGRRSEPPHSQWPWQRRAMVVAEPLVRGGDVVGAMVTVSPTDRLRHRVAIAWSVLAVLGFVALVVCFFVADRLARWLLRPVQVLDAATHEVATGQLDARVAADTGPPELRHLVSSFNDMADHVQASLEQQRSFVADASHQLRNPLSALLLRIDDLAGRVGEDLRPDAHRAVDEAKRLAGILERLLELARAEHAVGTIGSCDLVELVDERVLAWQPIATARQLTMRRLGPVRLSAWADDAAVAGALDVLLDNACKFSPENSTITVTVFVESDHAAVSVRDEGPGLAPDELSRAGDRFWRSRSQQNVLGFGLGLSIARALLEPAGGSLEIVAPDGGGLDVRLLLRREQSSSWSGDTSAAHPDAVAPGR